VNGKLPKKERGPSLGKRGAGEKEMTERNQAKGVQVPKNPPGNTKHSKIGKRLSLKTGLVYKKGNRRTGSWNARNEKQGGKSGHFPQCKVNTTKQGPFFDDPGKGMKKGEKNFKSWPNNEGTKENTGKKIKYEDKGT